ncbi:helix-hairpin-helix domain-containing protein [Rhodovulum sp. 12E13]|uniref:ComEA family DNA-binding protein n=1 Tax=Rhodovulum sp. 12E13 TaxID=2203891 RepID=UPI0018F6784D|nr:helix-hairpin-helix domain-containing protein [Rhodovulum sp. 12E13]
MPDDQEHRGEAFLRDDLGLVGTWVQTSYNASIRGKFAGIGDLYDPDLDVFAPPKPGPGWTLEASGTWSPPPQPAGTGWTLPEGAIAWNLDVNAADETALDELEGIGPTLAAAIVSERTAGGPFADLADLAARVDGISSDTTETWPAFAG